MAGSGTRRIALLLEYDGTDFAGSQLQKEQRTVQGALEEAIRAFTGEVARVAFAGRTDSGVHARGQVAALETSTAHSVSAFRGALNHFLPRDVAVRRAADVGAGFDPRRMALSRVYRYAIDDGGPRSPLRRRRTWQRRQPLDASVMVAAAALLPRVPADWAAFAGPVPDGYPTVRTLQRCEVRRCGQSRLEVTVEADGFLPHQVRRMVGVLERVGSGALSPSAFGSLIGAAPSSAGPAAPPQGLTLDEVRYPFGLVRWDDGQCDDDEDLPAE